jgi:hypothetical protein
MLRTTLFRTNAALRTRTFTTLRPLMAEGSTGGTRSGGEAAGYVSTTHLFHPTRPRESSWWSKLVTGASPIPPNSQPKSIPATKPPPAPSIPQRQPEIEHLSKTLKSIRRLDTKLTVSSIPEMRLHDERKPLRKDGLNRKR